jgi:hypothetical protein
MKPTASLHVRTTLGMAESEAVGVDGARCLVLLWGDSVPLKTIGDPCDLASLPDDLRAALAAAIRSQP